MNLLDPIKLTVIGAALFATACQPPVTSRTETGVAEYCATASDGTLAVAVEFATCTSGSCDTVVSATCTLSESGGVITLEAEAIIDSQGKVCTTDCGLVETMCTIDLPDGDYTLENGDETLSITVPSTDEACVGQSAV